jgi:hypothetical protein
MSIGDTTQPNVMAFEFGIIFNKIEGTAQWRTTSGYVDTEVNKYGPVLKIREEKHVSVHNDLKSAGYIVSKVRSQCESSVSNFNVNYTRIL